MTVDQTARPIEHIDYIAEAIRGALGDRCSEHSDGCPTCEAWKQYDELMCEPNEPYMLEVVSHQRKIPNGDWINVDKDTIDHYKAKGQAIRALVTLYDAKKTVLGERRKIAQLKRNIAALDKENIDLKTSLYIRDKANEAVSRSLVESKYALEKIKSEVSSTVDQKVLVGYFNGIVDFTSFGHALLFLTNDKRADNSVPLYSSPSFQESKEEHYGRK